MSQQISRYDFAVEIAIHFGLDASGTYDIKAIFPVMSSSCAFIMPTSSIRFIGRGSYACRAALGLALGGVPGVLLAAYVVKRLPVQYLLWLVIGVATYSALAMLNSARREATK